MASEKIFSRVEQMEPFQEIDTKGFNYLVIFKMEPNKMFSNQQIEKIKGLDGFHHNLRCPFITIRDSENIYLCLSGIVFDGDEHKLMWEHLVERNHIEYDFKGERREVDGGFLCISLDEKPYISYEFIPGAPDSQIIPGESSQTRQELQDMTGILCSC